MEVENIKAMLAHKYNEDKADYPAFIQPKLDGELYNHGLKDDFEKIISLVKKRKPTDADRAEAAELVQYHMYDVASLKMATYVDRNLFLLAEPSFKNSSILDVTSTRLATDFDDAQRFHAKNLKLGYEGSIYRTPSGKYKGTRSWDLMKFKDFHDAEATIVDFVAGKGKRTGTLGKFIMQDYEGVEFGCPPGKGYDYDALAEMLENAAQYVGQLATFTYFERTKAGSYRHPHYKCLRNYE